MAIQRALIQAIVAGAVLIGATAAVAQSAENYPSRVVKFIVPASAGGPSDIVARLVADKLSQALGQPVIVENRPGGSLMIGTSAVGKERSGRLHAAGDHQHADRHGAVHDEERAL